MKCPNSAPARPGSVSMKIDTFPVGKSKTRLLPGKVTLTTSFFAVFFTVTLRMSSLALPTSPEGSVNVAGLDTSATGSAAEEGADTSAGASSTAATRSFIPALCLPSGPGGEGHASRSVVRRPHHVRDRKRLAGEPDAVGEVLVVEDVVVEHLHTPLEEPHGARRALPLAAGVRRLHPLRLQVLEELRGRRPVVVGVGLAVELDLEPHLRLRRA